METIEQLINKAVKARETKRHDYDNLLCDIQAWHKYANYINDTFVNNELWKSLISQSNQNTQTKWREILDLLRDKDKGDGQIEKGLFSLLEDLGDGDKKLGLFTTAYHRINRPYVNIGVVGAFRQGKSTLLSQLIQPSSSNITSNTLFPTNNGANPCTGAPVNYINKDYRGNQNPTAVVVYHSVKSFSANINKYLEECGLSWDPIIINDNLTLDDLIRYCKNNTDNALKILNAQSNTLQGTLKNIILNYQKYIGLINKEEEAIDISTSAGMESFYDKITFNFGGRANNYAVYAVEEVNVYVRFKVDGKEVGEIQFLDTPGVGENRVGIDETLKNKLQNDIDTVIAIEAAHTGEVNFDALNGFHTSLKENYGEQQSNFIYYIINDQTNSDERLVSDAYKRAFKEGIETLPKPIRLNKNHKLVVDCKNNKVYNYQETPNGEVIRLALESEDNCQRVLYSIIENLAHNINEIDDVFNGKAKALYDSVKTKINDLKLLVKFIQLGQRSNYSEITMTMRKLNGELVDLALNPITEDIKFDVKKYADENECGSSVLNAILSYFDEAKINKPGASFTDVQKKEVIKKVSSNRELAEKTKAFKESSYGIMNKKGPCTSEEYGDWHEFEIYSKIKKKLYEEIVRCVKERIKVEPVLNSLKKVQTTVYEVFRKPCYLGFVCDSSKSNEEWYKTLMEMLDDVDLQKVFKDFFEYDAKGKMFSFIEDNIITSTIRPFMHRDDFNGSNFKTITEANYSLLGSLFMIEYIIKEALRDEEDCVIKKLKDTIDLDFNAVKTNVLNSANPNQLQLSDFVARNYDRILLCSGDNDDDLRKRSLVEQWQKNVINSDWI